MAKFYGEIGYGNTIEEPSGSGIYVDTITEIQYFGDVIKNIVRNNKGEKINNDISVNNSISIVADQQAIQHFFKIKYVRWAGVLWTITDVEVRNPRLILTLGSVYNGPTA
jgi:hypothetical protein